MKRVISIILVLAMLLSLCSCSFNYKKTLVMNEANRATRFIEVRQTTR